VAGASRVGSGGDVSAGLGRFDPRAVTIRVEARRPATLNAADFVEPEGSAPAFRFGIDEGTRQPIDPDSPPNVRIRRFDRETEQRTGQQSATLVQRQIEVDVRTGRSTETGPQTRPPIRTVGGEAAGVAPRQRDSDAATTGPAITPGGPTTAPQVQPEIVQRQRAQPELSPDDRQRTPPVIQPDQQTGPGQRAPPDSDRLTPPRPDQRAPPDTVQTPTPATTTTPTQAPVVQPAPQAPPRRPRPRADFDDDVDRFGDDDEEAFPTIEVGVENPISDQPGEDIDADIAGLDVGGDLI
jgi:hypothetical protein